MNLTLTVSWPAYSRQDALEMDDCPTLSIGFKTLFYRQNLHKTRLGRNHFYKKKSPCWKNGKCLKETFLLKQSFSAFHENIQQFSDLQLRERPCQASTRQNHWKVDRKGEGDSKTFEWPKSKQIFSTFQWEKGNTAYTDTLVAATRGRKNTSG